MTFGTKLPVTVKPLVDAAKKFDPHEPLEYINDNGDVVGVDGWQAVHEQGLLHRFCRVLLMNSHGAVIVQQRDNRITAGGKFDAPGGHLNVGEDYVTAAQRELAEEAGVVVATADLVPLGRITDQARPHIENMVGEAYLAVHDGPYTIEEGEVAGLYAVTPAALRREITKNPARFSEKLIQCLTLWEQYHAR